MGGVEDLIALRSCHVFTLCKAMFFSELQRSKEIEF